MAVSQQSQQAINQLEDELKIIKDQINNIGSLLSTTVKTNLDNLQGSARRLAKEFSSGKDITNELKGKIIDTRKSLNKLSTDRLDLEKQLAIATINKDKSAQKAITQKLYENKLEADILEDLLSQLKVLKQIVDEAERVNEEKLKQTKSERILNTLGIATLFTYKALLDAFFKIDNQSTQIGRSLGISKEAAVDMRKEMQAYANASGDAFVTGERLAKAQAGLTEQLGIAVDFGNQEREIFARLTEITGLSADEAGNLAKFSAATGKSTKDYVSSLRVAGMEASRANKIHISDKELLSSIAKLSAGILVKFQGNPDALAKAVIQAKKLGLSLEQVDKIGDSLLDWETSIGNELEAELITGKQLNFERARAAALTGDQATLMQEVANQAGSLSEFQNMNVIAQKSLAQAFGMSRDEMSEMLMKQEAINEYGDEAASLNAKQLEEMKRRNMSAKQYIEYTENQRSTQEKFNDLMTKFQETLANIASGPLGTILGMFATILENAIAMKIVVTAIAYLYGGMMVRALGQTIAKLAAELGLRRAIAVAAVTTAEATSLGLATLVIVGGLAYVMKAMNSEASKSMADGVMAPSGKILYSEEEGAIQLGKNDMVLAGTDLFGGRSNGGGGDSNAVIAMIGDKLDKYSQAIASVVQRPAVIRGEDAFVSQIARNPIVGTNQKIYTGYQVA